MNIISAWAVEVVALVLATVLAIGSLAVAVLHGWGWLIGGLALAGFLVGFVVRMRQTPADGRHGRPTVADDDQFVERLRSGEAVDDDPLGPALGAWRDESQGNRCRHCGEQVRRDGLALVGVADDVAACHAAPLVQCGYCTGDGCGSCEGNGETFGAHSVDEVTR